MFRPFILADKVFEVSVGTESAPQLDTELPGRRDERREPAHRQPAFRKIRGDAPEWRFDAARAHARASARRTRGSSIE